MLYSVCCMLMQFLYVLHYFAAYTKTLIIFPYLVLIEKRIVLDDESLDKILSISEIC